MENIEYTTREISNYYKNQRQIWDEFYPSERWVFERLSAEGGSLGDILDVGCACGGLGAVLSEKYQINSYVGVEINKASVDWARENRKIKAPHEFIYGDVAAMNLEKPSDIVFSLSCADWNLDTMGIINACWKNVKSDGHFVISLRLTDKAGINDMSRSYQYINFSGRDEKPEMANYVVFNFSDFLKLCTQFSPKPSMIGAYGYWGTPSSTAVTPFKELVFAVFYIKKGNPDSDGRIMTEFNLPLELFL